MAGAGTVVVRPIEPADLAAVLALNNSHSLELGQTDQERLGRSLSAATVAIVIGPVGQPDAFLIAFDHTVPAQGPNHAWFLGRRPRFLYVDRICVLPQARKRGLARALYSAVLAEAARRGTPLVCCEVNSEPPNPGSDAFHAALGFSEVGRAFLPDRGKSVRYLELGV
jgi:predicted GNAT superfamily acetyltransferase